MPQYRLVSSGHSEVTADAIVLSRDEETGEEVRISKTEAAEIPEDKFDDALALANKLGYKLVEVEVQAEKSEGEPDQSPDAAQPAAQTAEPQSTQ